MIKNIEDKILDISNSENNASLNARINEVKGEILSITSLATNASLSAKMNEAEGEVPSITNLATTAALVTDKTKIPNISYLVKKADCEAKTSEMEKNVLLFLIIVGSQAIHPMQK